VGRGGRRAAAQRETGGGGKPGARGRSAHGRQPADGRVRRAGHGGWAGGGCDAQGGTPRGARGRGGTTARRRRATPGTAGERMPTRRGARSRATTRQSQPWGCEVVAAPVHPRPPAARIPRRSATGRVRAVTGVGHPAQIGRLAHGLRQAPCHRPPAGGTRPGVGGPAGGVRDGRRRRDRGGRRRRRHPAPGADLLPRGALVRGAHRACRVPDDRGDGPGVPGPGADRHPAHRRSGPSAPPPRPASPSNPRRGPVSTHVWRRCSRSPTSCSTRATR